jgi:Protein of unknown function (DUF3108)
MMRNCLIPIVLSLASAAAAAAPPQHVEIEYELARNGSVLADISQRLDHDGRTYKLSETWKGKGLLSLKGEATRTSQGAIAADGLRPQKFEDKRTGRDTQHAEFDPAAKTATLQRQDRLSFIWNFAFAPPAAAATVIASDGKSATTYVFQAAGRERVKTPAGEFDALKLVKRRDNPQDKATEIWLAVDRQYIPVRILIVDKDGTRLDQLAAKISAQ